jgi:hypothetical protein
MPFDIEQTPDLRKSVTFDFPQMSVNDIQLNDGKYLEGSVSGGGSSANVVYSNNNIVLNFETESIRIYGILFPGLSKIEHKGTLVIKNIPMTNSPPDVYMCFLLNTKPNIPNDIDNIITSTSTESSKNLFLNNIIKPDTGTNKYIVYEGKDKSNNETTVIIYTSPIFVNTMSFTSTSSDWIKVVGPLSYSIVESAEYAGGEWMECDYAPMHSDEVITTYNIPIQSSILQDSSKMESFRTIIMFMVFLMLCIFSYLIIPSLYLAVVLKLVNFGSSGKTLYGEPLKKKILYIDIGISAVLGITGLVLLCVGAFSNPDKLKTTGEILLAGFAISIIYIISYVVVQSKKMTGKFIEGVKYDYV